MTKIQGKRAKYGEKQIFLFKGEYIERFLFMEYLMEKIIETFFKQFPEDAKTETGMIAKLHNLRTRAFFQHTLYLEPGFGYNSKVNAVRSIIQMVDGNFAKKSEKVFTLAQKLGEFRNILAHYHGSYKKGVVAKKYSKSFTVNDKSAEKEYRFIPISHQYKVTAQVKKELYQQLDDVAFFIYGFGEYEGDLYKGTKKGNINYKEISLDQFKENNSLSKDYGVFRFLK